MQPERDETPYQRHARLRLPNEEDAAELFFVIMGSFREMPPAILHAAGPRKREAQ